MEGLSRQERRRLAREVVDQQVTIGSLDNTGKMAGIMGEAMKFPELAALVARRAGRCDACGAKGGDGGVKLSTCRTCQGVSYCGKDCQRAAWPTHRPVCEITASTKLITSFKGVTNSDRLWSLEKIVKGMQHEDIRVVAEAFLHFNLRDIFVIFSRQSGTELGLENVANGSQLVAASVEAGVIPLLVNILASSPGGAGMWAAIALQRLANDYRGEIATADGIVVLARAVQLVADHPAMLELPEVVESTLQACSAIARLNHRAASFVPAFVAAGAVPPVVALLLCPEGSGLIIRRAGVKAPSKKLPSPHPVAALAALLEGSTQAAAEAAFAASALPKLVTLWGLGLKYGSADSEGCIQVNEFAMQCFDALGVHFGAEVAAAKAEAGIVDPPPPPLSPAAEAGGPSDDVPTQAAAGIAEPAAVPPPPAPAALADEPSGDAPTAAVATTGTDAGGNSGELGC